MDLLVILALAMASQEAGPAPETGTAEPPPGASRLVACLATRAARCGCAAEAIVLDNGPRLTCQARPEGAEAVAER
ncbi:MAG: hypothetical protein AAFR44_13065 [Pseudomonadota bacterium]